MTADKKILVAIGLLCFSASASAFRHLQTEGFTDPDYKGFTFKKAVILVQGASNEERGQIEKRLQEDLKDYGVDAVPYRSLLPPTRQWTPEQRQDVFLKEGVDAAIVVTAGASASSVIPMATQTFASASTNGTVNAYGNSANFNGYGASQNTSYNIMTAKSVAEFSAVLIDTVAGRTAWYVDITTKAAGTLFVSERGDAKAAVKGVVTQLRDDGHLLKPGK